MVAICAMIIAHDSWQLQFVDIVSNLMLMCDAT
jgi:hypothetical protein